MTDDELRTLLANFYAQRTLTRQPIDPEDCANAILFLAWAAGAVHLGSFDPRRRRVARGVLALMGLR